MKRALLSFVATLSFAAAAWAIEPPVTTLDNTPSGVYTLDTSHASVTFQISHLGFSNYTGRFNELNGTLNFDAKDPTKSSVEIIINPASVDVNHRELEGKLKKNEDAFNVEKFSTITFKSTKVTKLSDTKGTITGDLTLLGVTKPVTLDVTFNGSGMNPFAKAHTLGFSATGSIKRSEWGLKAWEKAVGDEVKLLIEVEFNQKLEEKKQ